MNAQSQGDFSTRRLSLSYIRIACLHGTQLNEKIQRFATDSS